MHRALRICQDSCKGAENRSEKQTLDIKNNSQASKIDIPLRATMAVLMGHDPAVLVITSFSWYWYAWVVFRHSEEIFFVK